MDPREKASNPNFTPDSMDLEPNGPQDFSTSSAVNQFQPNGPQDFSTSFAVNQFRPNGLQDFSMSSAVNQFQPNGLQDFSTSSAFNQFQLNAPQDFSTSSGSNPFQPNGPQDFSTSSGSNPFQPNVTQGYLAPQNNLTAAPTEAPIAGQNSEDPPANSEEHPVNPLWNPLTIEKELFGHELPRDLDNDLPFDLDSDLPFDLDNDLPFDLDNDLSGLGEHAGPSAPATTSSEVPAVTTGVPLTPSEVPSASIARVWKSRRKEWKREDERKMCLLQTEGADDLVIAKVNNGVHAIRDRKQTLEE
ncbi:hypothetical protein QBC39DRAFT_385385 [Podospora conica]|nr:hypothetical protein QBC39DRAFT_385385 [Schizothecium conicum]